MLFRSRHKNSVTFYPIVVLSSDNHIVYGDAIRAYLQKSILNIEDGYIIEKQNYGYDIAGLLHGIDRIFKNHSDQLSNKSLLAYLHNKNNFSWKNILHSIFYTDNIIDYDTVCSNTFTVNCELNDLNRIIINQYPEIYDNITDKKFKYVQGTTFITKLNFLKSLSDKFDKIKHHFTHINKNDSYWRQIMKDEQLFLKYYSQYQHNLLNTPIDYHSFNIINKDLTVKNYIELYKKYGLKGIPDCQFEHALERYIGYLTLNSNILKV